MLPIGLRTKRKQLFDDKYSNKLSSIDEQIRALENDLQKSGDDLEDVFEPDPVIEVRDDSDNVVVIKSTISDASIEPLPLHLLPSPNCGITTAKINKYNNKKTKKDATSTNNPVQQKSDGLEKTIKEMMKQYIPASADSIPFYCRICRYQGENLEQLMAHKETDFHKLAMKEERKFSTCKLCKKEFTSPLQLQEHLKGNMHLNKLEYIRNKQKAMKKFT